MDSLITSFLLQADAKALATTSKEGTINVVPVSSIKIEDGKIILVNYFMEKTLENILSNTAVALVAWSKMIGYQIKGSAEYYTSGDVFDRVVAWIKETIPSRIVKGVIVITPTEIHDIAPDKKTKEAFIKME